MNGDDAYEDEDDLFADDNNDGPSACIAREIVAVKLRKALVAIAPPVAPGPVATRGIAGGLRIVRTLRERNAVLARLHDPDDAVEDGRAHITDLLQQFLWLEGRLPEVSPDPTSSAPFDTTDFHADPVLVQLASALAPRAVQALRSALMLEEAHMLVYGEGRGGTPPSAAAGLLREQVQPPVSGGGGGGATPSRQQPPLPPGGDGCYVLCEVTVEPARLLHTLLLLEVHARALAMRPLRLDDEGAVAAPPGDVEGVVTLLLVACRGLTRALSGSSPADSVATKVRGFVDAHLPVVAHMWAAGRLVWVDLATHDCQVNGALAQLKLEHEALHYNVRQVGLMGDMRSDMGDMRSGMDDMRAGRGDMRAGMGDMRSGMDDMRSDIRGLQERMGGLEAQMRTVSQTLNELKALLTKT